MKNKFVPITVLVPDWAFVVLHDVAHEREWSVSHLVRFLILGSIAAWDRDSCESDDRELSEYHQ